MCPPLAGFSYAPFLSPSLQAGQVADFGALSPPRKFPFLTPKKCGVERFASELSLRQKSVLLTLSKQLTATKQRERRRPRAGAPAGRVQVTNLGGSEN
jgi:hypothetical protein